MRSGSVAAILAIVEGTRTDDASRATARELVVAECAHDGVAVTLLRNPHFGSACGACGTGLTPRFDYRVDEFVVDLVVVDDVVRRGMVVAVAEDTRPTVHWLTRNGVSGVTSPNDVMREIDLRKPEAWRARGREHQMQRLLHSLDLEAAARARRAGPLVGVH